MLDKLSRLFTRQPRLSPTAPGDTGLPADLAAAFTARTTALVAALPGRSVMTGAVHDRERGSLSVWVDTLPDPVRIAVTDQDLAEQVAAMPRLGRTTVHVTGDGPQLVVVAACENWLLALAGYPALTAV